MIEYNKHIDKWNTKEPGYDKRTRKLLFKTDELSEIDNEELNRTNENKIDSMKWIELDVEKIYNSFIKDAKKNKSIILDMYIEHYTKLYNDIKFISKDSPKEWNKRNWKTFFEDFYDRKYKGKYGSRHYVCVVFIISICLYVSITQ